MTPEREARARSIVDRIYEAVIDVRAWDDVVVALSAELGDAALAVNLGIRTTPSEALRMQVPKIHLRDDMRPVAIRHHVAGLPWGWFVRPDRFRRGSDVLPDERVADTAYYREYMEPQGLAPEGPFGLALEMDGERFTAGVVIFRRVGCRALTGDDLAFCDRLAPHLVRAYRLWRRHSQSLERRDALAQVIDRLPTGVVLLDENCRAVVTNRTAGAFSDAKDGIVLTADGPRAAFAHEDEALRDLMQSAVAAGMRGSGEGGGIMTLTRPSGRRSFSAVTMPLLPHADGSPGQPPVAVLWLTDPELGQPSSTDVLRTLYSLTPAEAELARLLAEGRRLDDAAAIRGVTLNTARTQLKHVFAKTGTRRQSEVVRLVLSSIGSVDVSPPGASGHGTEGKTGAD